MLHISILSRLPRQFYSPPLYHAPAPIAYYGFLTDIMEMSEVPSGTANASSTDFLSALESTMDSKNTFSQQTMIELQSQTTKRDQAYDMVSNVLKSINTVLIGNANNM